MLGLASSGSYRIGDAQASVGISALLFGGLSGLGLLGALPETSHPLPSRVSPHEYKKCLFHRRIGIMRSRGALNPAAQRNDFEGRKHGQAPLPSCMYGAVPATSRSVGVLKRPRSCGSCVTAKRPSSSKRPSRKATPVLWKPWRSPSAKSSRSAPLRTSGWHSGLPSDTRTIQRSLVPERSLVKTTARPSGVHLGTPSVPPANSGISRLPSAAIAKRRRRLFGCGRNRADWSLALHGDRQRYGSRLAGAKRWTSETRLIGARGASSILNRPECRKASVPPKNRRTAISGCAASGVRATPDACPG